MKIAISGSNGLIGTSLKPYLKNMGYQVIPIVRNPNQDGLLWNPENEDINSELLEGFDCLINLNGKKIDRILPISEKESIKNSRISSTKTLSSAISKLTNPPKIFLSASGFGYYGDRGLQNLTENEPPGKGFLSQLAMEWENSATHYIPANINIRVIIMRFGLVLSKEGGLLSRLNTLVNIGIGKRFGNGNQYWPWISLEDTVSAICHAINTPVLKGPVNFVSSHQVTNKEFMQTLFKSKKRYGLAPIPKNLLKIFSTELTSETLLGSTRMYPEKLLSSNFKFRFDSLEKTLQEYYQA